MHIHEAINPCCFLCMNRGNAYTNERVLNYRTVNPEACWCLSVCCVTFNSFAVSTSLPILELCWVVLYFIILEMSWFFLCAWMNDRCRYLTVLKFAFQSWATISYDAKPSWPFKYKLLTLTHTTETRWFIWSLPDVFFVFFQLCNWATSF